MTTDNLIECVKIYGGQGGRYEAAYLPRSSKIFSSPLPITQKFGYPLVINRLQSRLPRGAETDNQHATWLMIDPVSGFAPPAWQGGIGHVYVACADFSPLKVEILSGIVDYVSTILDMFGEGSPSAVQKYYNRQRLDFFLEKYNQNVSEQDSKDAEIHGGLQAEPREVSYSLKDLGKAANQ